MNPNARFASSIAVSNKPHPTSLILRGVASKTISPSTEDTFPAHKVYAIQRFHYYSDYTRYSRMFATSQLCTTYWHYVAIIVSLSAIPHKDAV